MSGSSEVRLTREHLVLPVVLVLIGISLFVWVQSKELDSIEARTLNTEFILGSVQRHLELAVMATAIVIAIGVPLGVLFTRPRLRRFSAPIVAVANAGQSIPSIGLLVLMAIYLGIGYWIAVWALVIYALLPVLRNTMVGILQVDESLLEAARGVGMGRLRVLWQVELPLAVPVMLAGIRVALILAVGTATLATFINGGGLGDLINNGIKLNRDPVLVTGAVLTVILALGIDWIAGIVEALLRPRGI